jgi:hypothetical protein
MNLNFESCLAELRVSILLIVHKGAPKEFSTKYLVLCAVIHVDKEIRVIFKHILGVWLPFCGRIFMYVDLKLGCLIKYSAPL